MKYRDIGSGELQRYRQISEVVMKYRGIGRDKKVVMNC